MIILGIDPGSRLLGVGLIDFNPTTEGVTHEHHSTIKVSDKLKFHTKLHFIHDELAKIIEEYQPKEMSIEKIFYGKNADSAFKLGQVRGVVLLLAAKYQINVFEYAPKSVKKMVSGNGNANKEHLRLIAFNILKISSQESLDASDALALALAHTNYLIGQRKTIQMENLVL